ncbi:MAG: Lysophospholipase 1 [Peltula sp. TS41687]|nr:MAG: Lysophospholipase 1 [Peltula sp. TS41687]
MHEYGHAAAWLPVPDLITGILAASASPSSALEPVEAFVRSKRSFSDSPTGGYEPGRVDCPADRPRIRTASALSPNETAWLRLRRNNTIDPMRQFLARMNITDFDAASYIDRHRNNASALPNVAIAASGGGYRALFNGGGAISAFDSRTPGSTDSGHLGGLLQLSTYLAGLSGGGWLVGTIFINNFTTIRQLQEGSSGGSYWDFSRSIFEGPDTRGLSVINTIDYFSDIQRAVQSKSDAGFNTSITDYWGRGLSYQLLNSSNGGPGITWSSISQGSDFLSGQTPLPILVADGRAPNELLIPSNTTVFEFTPWEFGSFDPTTYGFAPLRYLGSNFSGGVLPNDQACIRGFDNAGFVMGTSSSLFNQFLLNINNTSVPSAFKGIINGVLENLNESNNDIADYRPNPFYHYNNESNLSAGSKSLTVVDGGEDLQNIPLHPLIQSPRGVDVIFAVDSSADTHNNWPNGTALVATYDRSSHAIQNGTVFPAIPDQNTFVNLGLNTRPTFFGCDSRNQTGPSPLLVYLPNSPYIYHSNVSTIDSSYTARERDAIIVNGYNVVTMANATQDAQWPACVGCAIISRSLERTGTQVPSICRSCFQRYCWDGTRNSTRPAPYNPTFKSTEVKVTSWASKIDFPLWAISVMIASIWMTSANL